MITVTIEGPQGSGKSKIGNALIKTLVSLELRFMYLEEITDNAMIRYKNNIDVLIVEKQSK